MSSPIIIALDLDLHSALSLAKQLSPKDCQLKLGHQLFTSEGPNSVKRFQELGFKIFLDLKYHDIPNTIFSAVSSALDLGIWMLNVHASGGLEMINAAVSAREKSKKSSTILLGVTVLTSLDNSSLERIGFKANTEETVKNLALLSKEGGLDGVVCSVGEIKGLRRVLGDNFILVTPGIRSAKGNMHDQKRVSSPKEAIMEGADYIVMGREIIRQDSPQKKLEEILEEISN